MHFSALSIWTPWSWFQSRSSVGDSGFDQSFNLTFTCINWKQYFFFSYSMHTKDNLQNNYIKYTWNKTKEKIQSQQEVAEDWLCSFQQCQFERHGHHFNHVLLLDYWLLIFLIFDAYKRQFAKWPHQLYVELNERKSQWRGWRRLIMYFSVMSIWTLWSSHVLPLGILFLINPLNLTFT